MANVKRQLGKDGPMVSPIGLGCMGMSGFYANRPSEEECVKVLIGSIDSGCVFWDTADLYASGANEELLAKVLASRRDEIFICTKFGCYIDPKTKEVAVRGDKEYVKQCCDASLKRLGIETIDLYYQHRVDPKTPIEETISAMAELVKENKVKYLGLSECSADTLRKAYKVHPIHAVQVEYSPWSTSIEKNGLLDACRELGVTVICYSPLGRGFLTGKLNTKELADDDFRKNNPRMSGENLDHNLELVNKFEEIAKSKNITASQLCLAWILKQGKDFIPIPGTRRLKYLEENLGALKVDLSKEEEAQIRSLVDEIQVKGDRYKAEEMKMNEI